MHFFRFTYFYYAKYTHIFRNNGYVLLRRNTHAYIHIYLDKSFFLKEKQ